MGNDLQVCVCVFSAVSLLHYNNLKILHRLKSANLQSAQQKLKPQQVHPGLMKLFSLSYPITSKNLL